jgi:hypothetical protein
MNFYQFVDREAQRDNIYERKKKRKRKTKEKKK